jgi:hypothetical protein
LPLSSPRGGRRGNREIGVGGVKEEGNEVAGEKGPQGADSLGRSFSQGRRLVNSLHKTQERICV